MHDVLDFVYSGECRLNQENVEDLLRAAAIFQLSTLKDMCDFFIKDTVHAKNALRLYKVNDQHFENQDTRIRLHYLNFITRAKISSYSFFSDHTNNLIEH